jgi:Flp pilus assembly protein TadG
MATPPGAASTAWSRRQRGSVSTELVIVTPVVLLLVMLVIEFALWQHAQHIAETAAQSGAETARVESGTDSQGRAMAQTAIAQLGASLLVDPAVTISRRGGIVTVNVSGTAPGLVPFLSLPVHATAAGPVERFQPANAAAP